MHGSLYALSENVNMYYIGKTASKQVTMHAYLHARTPH
jgi:hypothetical protein